MSLFRRLVGPLQNRLLLSHLAVAVVGIIVLFVTARLSAPDLFERHVAERMAARVAAPERPAGSGPPPGRGPEQIAPEVDAAFREALTQGLALAGGVALLVGMVGSLLLARQVAGPVRRMVTATEQIASGSYDERVPVTGSQEVAALAISFNAMAEALATTERRRLELISDVAHELRTPLATLQGYLEGLVDGVVEPSERTWTTLQTETARLTRLVADLQEVSRAEAGQLPLSLQSVAPGVMVQAAVDRVAAEAAAKGLTLRVDLAPDLPLVRADPDRVVQVLTNLLTNAVRYTPPPGRIDVRVTAVAGRARFSVQDTGAGVAPEHLPHLFDRFYRVDRSRSRALGGSGIGLTISRALVEAMDGRITAASAGPNQGTTVTFDLPLAA